MTVFPLSFLSTVNNITGMNANTAIICGASRPDLWRPVGVGVACVPAITSLVLPAMVGRRKGAVVNVCSPTATLSLTRLHVYTAAKVSMCFLSSSSLLSSSLIVCLLSLWSALLNQSQVCHLFKTFPLIIVKDAAQQDKKNIGNKATKHSISLLFLWLDLLNQSQIFPLFKTYSFVIVKVAGQGDTKRGNKGIKYSLHLMFSWSNLLSQSQICPLFKT